MTLTHVVGRNFEDVTGGIRENRPIGNNDVYIPSLSFLLGKYIHLKREFNAAAMAGLPPLGAQPPEMKFSVDTRLFAGNYNDIVLDSFPFIMIEPGDPIFKGWLAHRVNVDCVQSMRPQYRHFDHLKFRVLEQCFWYMVNYLNTMCHAFTWGAGIQGWKSLQWTWKRLRQENIANRNAFMSRENYPLLDFEDTTLPFRRDSMSLQAQLCRSMRDSLPPLRTEMDQWIRQRNIPNASLFLRIVRCNNIIALRELAQQYYDKSMQPQVSKVLSQMPVITE